eukprot:4329612-Prorocentrum_lima.AAC.1
MRPGGASRAAEIGVPGTTTAIPERPAAVSASWGVPGSGSPVGSWTMSSVIKMRERIPLVAMERALEWCRCQSWMMKRS